MGAYIHVFGRKKRPCYVSIDAGGAKWGTELVQWTMSIAVLLFLEVFDYTVVIWIMT